MEQGARSNRVLRFAAFEADLQTGELRKGGLKLALQEQPFRVLAVLLENQGQVVSREQLREELWPGGTFVDFDHGVNTAINKIRECLRDTATHPRFVETVPRRGYRFLAPVEQVNEAAASPEAGPRTEQEAPSTPLPPTAGIWGRRRVAVVAGAVAAALVVVALFAYQSRSASRQRATTAPQSSIAVLPFVDLSPAGDQEYFSDGLTDELINALSRVPNLRVIGRTSAFEFKGKTQDVRRIGERLNVEALLEGSVRKSGDRLRIAAQLINARTGYQLWSESYDTQLTDALNIQTTIAQTICDQLRVRPASERVERTRAHSRDVTAVDAYLQARYLANKRTPDSLMKSIELFEQAIARDSAYALAYSGLAESYTLQLAYNLRPARDAAPRVRAAALKALALDDTLAEAHSLLGGVKLYHDWDWAGAEREQRRAIELEPRFAHARQRYALNLMWTGRFEEALREIRRAQELDPLSPVFQMNEGEILYNARRYDEAIEHCRKIIDRAPRVFQTYRVLGQSYAAKGMYPQAIRELRQAVLAGGNNPHVKALLGYAYAVSGDRRAALEVLRDLEHSAEDSLFGSAAIHLGLGEKARALDFLEQGYRERSRTILFLRVSPMFDPLRSEPRFLALLKRVPLPG